MAHSTTYYGFWAQYNGRTVRLQGCTHRIETHTYTQRYPYEQEVISVHAVPVNKASQYYHTIKEQLGEDWSTDVLDSDIDVQSEILSQLQA